MREVYRIACDLFERDPERDHYRGTRASFAMTLANELSREGKRAEALSLLRAAETDLRRLAERYPDDPHRRNRHDFSLYQLFNAEAEMGAPADRLLALIRERIERTESYGRDHGPPAASLLTHLSTIYLALATVAENDGQFAVAREAEANADRITRLDIEEFPQSAVYRMRRVGVLNRLGHRAIRVDRMAAVAYFCAARRLARNERDSPHSQSFTASSLLYTVPELRRPEEALRLLRVILTGPEATPQDRVNVAIALHFAGRFADADAEFRRCEPFLTDYGSNSDIWLVRAMARFHTGETAWARRELREITARMRADYRTPVEQKVFLAEAWLAIEGHVPEWKVFFKREP